MCRQIETIGLTTSFDTTFEYKEIELTQSRLYRLPLDGEWRKNFIASMQNRNQLSEKENEALESFSEKLMGIIWTLVRKPTEQNGPFVPALESRV